MGVQVERFVRANLSPEMLAEVRRVDELAEQLATHLREQDARIASAHVHGAPSSAIQSIVAELLVSHLGFGEEVVLTPDDGFVSSARPDFFFSLSPGRGVLAEVERGGTVNNNHDLKDVWKAHIAPDAQHLFLLVPNSNWTPSGTPRERPFKRVVHRMASFFGDPRREVDILSLHVFGYGELEHAASGSAQG
jgi:hypothetical protein